MPEGSDPTYLVVVQFKPDSPIRRVQDDAPGLVAALKSAATGGEQLAFRSSDGLLFGYFIQAHLLEWEVLERLRSTTHIVNGDSILVLELGERFKALQFGRQLAWLEHH